MKGFFTLKKENAQLIAENDRLKEELLKAEKSNAALQKDNVELQETNVRQQEANEVLQETNNKCGKEIYNLKAKNRELLHKRFSLTGDRMIDKALRALGISIRGWLGRNIPAKNLCERIYALVDELKMQYQKPNFIPIKVGDLLEGNFGRRLSAEFSGAYSWAIVVDKPSWNTVEIIPVLNRNEEVYEANIELTEDDIKWNVDKNFKGEALEKKGKVLVQATGIYNRERFRKKIGRCSRKYYEEVINAIVDTKKQVYSQNLEAYTEETE